MLDLTPRFDSLPGATADEYDCVLAPSHRLIEFFPYPGSANPGYPRPGVYEFDYAGDRFSFERRTDASHKVCKVRKPEKPK